VTCPDRFTKTSLLGKGEKRKGNEHALPGGILGRKKKEKRSLPNNPTLQKKKREKGENLTIRGRDGSCFQYSDT